MDKLTIEEHKTIGMIAKMLNVRLLGNVPKYNSKRETLKCHHMMAEKHLSEFKNHMEEIMFTDYPNNLKVIPGIYYGERAEGDINDWLRGKGRDIDG